MRSIYLLMFMLTAFALVISNTPASASIIYQHTGATDPTTEGWSTGTTPTGMPVGPIINDMGSGIDAWFVDDPETFIGSTKGYKQIPTALLNTQAGTLGWTLSARVKATNSGGTFNDSVDILYENGTRGFLMQFDDRTGDQRVLLGLDAGPNPTYTDAGGGAVYHLYELKYDPVALSADLFVDGVERISDYIGYSTSSAPDSTRNRVIFGALGSDATGKGSWSLVQFEIHDSVVPEPSTFAIWSVLVGIGFIAHRRRRKPAA